MQWSCNAPILEIVLKKIVAQVVWKRFDVEASISSDMEIYYHNIQKAGVNKFSLSPSVFVAVRESRKSSIC